MVAASGSGAAVDSGSMVEQWGGIDSDELLEELHRLDALDRSRADIQQVLQQQEPSVRAAVAAAEAEAAEVPGGRIIRDPVELDLVGQGLPIINGVSATHWWSMAFAILLQVRFCPYFWNQAAQACRHRPLSTLLAPDGAGSSVAGAMRHHCWDCLHEIR